MMRNRALVGAAAATLLMLSSSAWAQEFVRVRGTIERVDGPAYAIKSRDGTELKVQLDDKATVVALTKASLADIKPGTFVGITGLPQPDGSQKAVEVHIFPESARGTGEGHYAWDLQPNSTMTNGNVEQAVTSVEGDALTVKYKDGEKKIIVPPATPIVAFEPGKKDDLKPGVKIFVARATKQEDGTLLAPRINYGKDGVTPPM